MTISEANARGMPVVAALEVLIELRRDEQIVITNQAAARIWPKLSRQALDFHYNPSTMGGAIPLAVGLALAQPGREVLVVTGDGSLLMSLGALVTVVGAGVTNLTIMALDNGMYEVTGGQKTAATGRGVSLPDVARGCGFVSVNEFGELAAWQAGAADVLALPGPRFVSLEVQRTPRDYLSSPTPPIAEQLAELRRGLGTSVATGR